MKMPSTLDNVVAALPYIGLIIAIMVSFFAVDWVKSHWPRR